MPKNDKYLDRYKFYYMNNVREKNKSTGTIITYSANASYTSEKNGSHGLKYYAYVKMALEN